MRLTTYAFIAGVTLVSAAPRPVEAVDMGGLAPSGEYLVLGGGVTDFYEGDVKDRVGVGGAWDLRFGLGSRSVVGAEVAYVGSARDADGLGENLLANGAEGVLRLQLPLGNGRWRVAPFAFGGIGWSHLDVDSATAADARDTDDVMVLPVGGGLMLDVGKLVLDTRFTHRETVGEDLIRAQAGDEPSLSSWAVTASLGREF